jgi:phenylalanyl-tRNA synthetase alpha chain
MLDRWVEVGNSGMFRPEMLEPMGFPKDVRVHGWGLSLERPTMIRWVFLVFLLLSLFGVCLF